MTETELVEDLSRLLREGLVVVDVDAPDDDAWPVRFQVTARGREVQAAGSDEDLQEPGF
jgi:hypothetical protein